MATSTEIERIEGDLARTRERMAGRIDELEHRLVPRQMLNDAFVRLRGGRGADFTDDLVARVKANPVPAGIAGVAVAWLMSARGPAPVKSRSRPPIISTGSASSDDASMTDSRSPQTAPIVDAADHTTPLTTGTRPMANPTRNTLSSVTGNPFALGAAAALVGIIGGALIPTLRKEEEALGSVATKLRVAGRDLAQDVVDRSGHVVEDTLGAVKGSADAHGLSAAKPIGEVFADVKSGALVGDVKHVAQEALQAGRNSAQTHLSSSTDKPQPDVG
ncbi:MAG: DUF3618 domain-containing protein [Janthinobacterium lividum]